MLSTSRLTKSFGEATVLSEVDMEFREGEMHVIIGPNGAGKTTFVNVVTGVYAPDSGIISLDSREITKMKTHRRTQAGIGRTFQIPKPFMDLSVFENVLVGSLFGSGASNEEAQEVARKNIEFVGLSGKMTTLAKELTSSQMKMLDLARALSGRPKYLFVDELAAGLSQSEIENVANLIRKINETGICIVYIGHVMTLVKKLGGTVTAMSEGKVITRGNYEEVARQPEVLKVYLGEDYA